VEPSRRGDARGGQIEVENGLRLFGHRQYLAAEQAPEGPVACCRLVHRRDVHQLVIHERVQPLVGGNRLEDVGDWRDLDRDQIVRHGGGAGVALVRQVDEKDRDVFLRVESKQLLLEGERVQRRPRRVRDEKRFTAVDEQQPQAGGSLFGELRDRNRRDEHAK
jgi:hypothetical protein